MKPTTQICGGDIKSLNPRHFKIIDLAVKGYSNKRIGETLEMTAKQVCRVLRSPCATHELAIRRAVYENMEDSKQVDEEDEVVKILKDGAIEAARKIVSHIDSSDGAISVRSCADVLDRTGYAAKKVSPISVSDATIMISSKDADRLSESLKISQS